MLYIISTPIGNLKDITKRAIEVLESVDYLLCEDTRVSGGLLEKLEIKNKPKLISFYDEVEEQKIPEIINILNDDKNVALVSDAGTPLLSDPGYKLVKKCRQLNLALTSIPGPSSITNALVISGMPSGRFSFLGFLPKKPGERLKILKKYLEIDGSKVVFESPFRIDKLLNEIKTVYGENVEVVICREMTKKFEEVISGKIDELIERINKKPIKGEIVVVFG